jgi:hypothetical protein
MNRQAPARRNAGGVREEKGPALAKATLPPLVEQTDILGRGIFANHHFAFLSATLRMNRDRHTIALDVDHESPQFEVIAQCLMQQAARMRYRWVIH